MIDTVWVMVMSLLSYLQDMLIQVEKICMYVCMCICVYVYMCVCVCVLVSRLDVYGVLYISETCLSSSLCLSVLTLVST